MPVPAAATTAVAGQPARASAQFNALAAQMAFALNPPSVRAHQTAAQSVASNTATVVTLDAETVDTDGIHSLTTNTSRLTIVSGGTYRVTGTCGLNAGTGVVTVRLTKNGVVTTAVRTMLGASSAVYTPITDEIPCVATDYVEMTVTHTNSTAINTTASSDTVFLQARWVSI